MLCAEQILNCAQGMGDRLLTCDGVGFTLKVSSTVVISEKKKKKREGERRAGKMFWKLDCLAVINRSRTMQKRWVTDS